MIVLAAWLFWGETAFKQDSVCFCPFIALLVFWIWIFFCSKLLTQQLHLFSSFLCCQHIVWGILGKTSSIVHHYNACRLEPGAVSAALALTGFGKRRLWAACDCFATGRWRFCPVSSSRGSQWREWWLCDLYRSLQGAASLRDHFGLPWQDMESPTVFEMDVPNPSAVVSSQKIERVLTLKKPYFI